MPTFTDNDVRLLDKTLSIRERIIDDILNKEKLPTSPRELEVFTSLLNSVDGSILGRAKINIEDTNSKINEETKNTLRCLLLDLHKNVNATQSLTNEDNGNQEFKSLSIAVSEGELIEKMDEMDVKSILENR